MPILAFTRSISENECMTFANLLGLSEYKRLHLFNDETCDNDFDDPSKLLDNAAAIILKFEKCDECSLVVIDEPKVGSSLLNIKENSFLGFINQNTITSSPVLAKMSDVFQILFLIRLMEDGVVKKGREQEVIEHMKMSINLPEISDFTKNNISEIETRMFDIYKSEMIISKSF